MDSDRRDRGGNAKIYVSNLSIAVKVLVDSVYRR